MAGLGTMTRMSGAQITASTVRPTARRTLEMEEAATATATKGMRAVLFLLLNHWFRNPFRNSRSRRLLWQELQCNSIITTSSVGPSMAGLGTMTRMSGAQITASTVRPTARRTLEMEEAATATATKGMRAVLFLLLNHWFRNPFRNSRSRRLLWQELQCNSIITTSSVGPSMAGLETMTRMSGAQTTASTSRPTARRTLEMEEAATATATKGMRVVLLPAFHLFSSSLIKI